MARNKPEGDGESGTITIRYDQQEAPTSFVATGYAVHATHEAVTLSFKFSTPTVRGVPAIAVWIPRDMLPRTMLRETERFTKAIGTWSERPTDPGEPATDPSTWPISTVYSANAASAAVSDVGAAMRFYWFSAAKFAQRQPTVPATIVLEVRMTGQLFARLWLELKAIADSDKKIPAEA